jgi:hypothetical protein
MSNTTTTTTTKPAASKANHSGKVTAASRAYSKALQQPAVRDGYFKDGKGFAVDVQLNGSAAYQAGVIVRFFNDRAGAEAMVAAINSGNLAALGSKANWYSQRKARGARVVPAYNVPNGKSAVDVLKATAKAGQRKAASGKATPATALPAPAAPAAALPASS